MRKYKNIFQNVYSLVYPDVYYNSERRSFDIKNEFQIKFKEYKNKKSEQFGKDPNAYKNREDISPFEQKPISVDVFTKEDEEKLAEKIERRKQKRRELAEKNKELKQKKNLKMLKMKKNYGKGLMFVIKKLQPLKKRRKKNQKCLLLF